MIGQLAVIGYHLEELLNLGPVKIDFFLVQSQPSPEPMNLITLLLHSPAPFDLSFVSDVKVLIHIGRL